MFVDTGRRVTRSQAASAKSTAKPKQPPASARPSTKSSKHPSGEKKRTAVPTRKTEQEREIVDSQGADEQPVIEPVDSQSDGEPKASSDSSTNDSQQPSLTRVNTTRGDQSFAPADFQFKAPTEIQSFVFKPLSPSSAANFLFPGNGEMSGLGLSPVTGGGKKKR